MSTLAISLLSGLGGMFGWGMYDFFAGVYAKKIGPFSTFFWSQLAGVFCIVLLTPLVWSHFKLSLPVVLLLPVAAFLYASGYLFFMRGFEIGNISIVAAIMNLWAVFTMAIAYIFVGQRLSTWQAVGVFLIVFGAVAASINWKDFKSKKFQLSAGVKETVVGAFLFGTFWNVSEFLSEEMGWLQATACIKLGIVLLLALFAAVTNKKIKLSSVSTGTKWVLVFMGIIEAAAITVVNFGLTIGDAILITPIASALSVVTILMAMVFLKEKIHSLQATGVLISVLGIIVTSL